MVEVCFGHQSHNVVEDDCLAFALLGFFGALALTGGKLARDRCGEQEHEKRQPLLGV